MKNIPLSDRLGVVPDRDTDATEVEQRRNRAWLDSMADGYPHRATGPSTLRGDTGDAFGPCVSRRTAPAGRTWAFREESARDRFVEWLKMPTEVREDRR